MSLNTAIIDTLRYSHQFKYPLTSYEVYNYLIYPKKTSFDIVNKHLASLTKKKKIVKIKDYYMLKRSPTWVYNRETSQVKVKKIIAKAEKDLKFLGKLFFIKYIGITGSVAANNPSLYYDVDLFFIMQKNFLWIGRFFVWLYLKIKKIYRLPYCPNIYISQDFLKWENENVYIANEIVRMKTLINKESHYELFLFNNMWVLNYLPNFKIFKFKNTSCKSFSIISLLFLPIEYMFYSIQYLYMRSKITTEVVTLKRILFFKNDYSVKILNNFYQTT